MKKILLLLCIGLISCTENQRARHFGGIEKIKLNKNEVIINVTWKDTEMWICTKDTITNKIYFREKSNFGLLEGTVVFE